MLFTGISQLVSPAAGEGALRGARMREIQITTDAAMAISNGQIDWIGTRSEWAGTAQQEIDLGGRAVVPGLVDPHTRASWAGDRLADFEARTSGVAYETILAGGGGIRSTIRQTASKTNDELVALARPRVAALLRSGATTIEVKTGYGFDPDIELRMLDATHQLDQVTPATIAATLLVHIPPANPADRG